MSTGLTESPVTSSTRRPRAAKAPKGTSRQGDAKPKKVSFYLSPEAIRRLGVTAAMESTDKSRVVEQLIADHLKRWVVSDRARSADGAMVATQEVSAD